jgi:hypothetical protein
LLWNESHISAACVTTAYLATTAGAM